MAKPIIAIVPAAGIGSRMQSDVAKQYLKIADEYVLSHTLKTLVTHKSITKVIVALNKNDTIFKSMPIAADLKICTVIGGNTRQDSVLEALKIAEQDAYALVHDAARPCLQHEDIDKLIKELETSPSGVVLVSKVRDTLKKVIDREITSTVKRDNLWQALTPQVFMVSTLKANILDAMKKGYQCTDESSVMELAGVNPKIVVGRMDNIKITFPEDLQLATLFLRNN